MDNELKELLDFYNWTKESHNGQIISFVYSQNKIIDIQNELNNYIKKTNRTWTWYRKLKEESEIFDIIIRHKIYFQNDKRYVKFEKIFNVIHGLLAYTKIHNVKTYTRVPDRLLTKHSQLSRDTVFFIINECRKLGLIKIKIKKGWVLFKLSDSIINDPLINYLADSHISKIRYKENEITSKHNTLFFEEPTIITRNKKLTKTILGLSIAYTELYRKQIIGEKRLDDIDKFGERSDIYYLQIPIPIISKILGISRNKLIRYLSHVCNGSRFLAKHDKVYIETKEVDNYYQELYKKFKLENSKNIILDDNHPLVTKYSYILFMDEFKKTRQYKDIVKNLDKYMKELVRFIELYNSGLLTDADIEQAHDNIQKMLEEAKTEESLEMKDKDYQYKASKEIDIKADIREFKDHIGLYDPKLECQDILHFKLPIKFNMKDMNINKAVSIIRSTMKRINDININIGNREFDRYTRIITKLINWIQDGLNYLKEKYPGRFESWKSYLTKYDIAYNFKF